MKDPLTRDGTPTIVAIRLDRAEPFHFDSDSNLPVFPRNAATFDTDIPLPSNDPGPPPPADPAP